MKDLALVCITLLIFALGYLVAAGLDRMAGTKQKRTLSNKIYAKTSRKSIKR